ncbi:acetolactate synthase [Metarhizium album ARSEF 1941]|uniref:Acetolactate synthase n=1 Tax=Metarhizium album (strain ARSEF 1941) TaxID=1081103 RepID=A0A0B2WLL9_METAS|nr:acetolactate synthase [Metarhizium album ARSEF 1941]KHN93915.1 acetolactate synthase [Metarhizium album ARSEF 1941]
MSMADGFARVTGKPQCVIVHVDVGTQALGVAVHNASVGRAPVLVFAGMSPCTLEGELRSSWTEHIHWLQDVPDQKVVVGQYCRYAAEIKTGANIKQIVNRALQFATSGPQGPVYLCAAREVLEADLEAYEIQQDQWDAVELGGFSQKCADRIARALARADRPLLVTGNSGRNLHRLPWSGMRVGAHAAIKEADVILVLDCDVPWIPTRCRPRKEATIFYIDVDPLKQQMPLFYIASQAQYRADALTAVEQILQMLTTGQAAEMLGQRDTAAAEELRSASYTKLLSQISRAARPFADGTFGTDYLSSLLRRVCPEETIWAVEAVTNATFIHDNIQPSIPGSWINCGGGGLGWSGGGALGIKLATDSEAGGSGKGKFVCQIVGDGTYLFSVPGSVYWISKRYKIPVLTIVLNNDDGEAATATNKDINISFSPCPDDAGIAAAAGAATFTPSGRAVRTN